MQSKSTTKIIIDKLKLDVLFRLNVSDSDIVKKLKGENVVTSDPIVNDLLDSLIDTKTFSNWGGNHNPTGKNQYTKSGQDGQVDHQVDLQVDRSRSGQDADKDIDNINNKNINNNNISTTRVNNQSRSNLVNSGQIGQIGQKNQNIQNNQKNQIDNQIEKTRIHNALEIFGNSFKATDAVVGVFDKPDGTTHEGIRIKNPRLMAFIRQRFDSNVLSKVSDWAIDHNQRGHTYNATSLLKLLCKFQSNVEPTINFNSVQAEYLTFEYKQPQK